MCTRAWNSCSPSVPPPTPVGSATPKHCCACVIASSPGQRKWRAGRPRHLPRAGADPLELLLQVLQGADGGQVGLQGVDGGVDGVQRWGRGRLPHRRPAPPTGKPAAIVLCSRRATPPRQTALWQREPTGSHCQSDICCGCMAPSKGSLFTGMPPHNCGAHCETRRKWHGK